MALKVQSPWIEDQEATYCDGSRNHGCGGCFCRRPEFYSYRQPCGRCGRMFFDLLDTLWDIRREVYKTYAFKHMSWRDLFLIEIAIEEKLPAAISKKTPANPTSRSQVWALHAAVAKAVTAHVINVKIAQQQRQQQRRSSRQRSSSRQRDIPSAPSTTPPPAYESSDSSESE